MKLPWAKPWPPGPALGRLLPGGCCWGPLLGTCWKFMLALPPIANWLALLPWAWRWRFWALLFSSCRARPLPPSGTRISEEGGLTLALALAVLHELDDLGADLDELLVLQLLPGLALLVGFVDRAFEVVGLEGADHYTHINVG